MFDDPQRDLRRLHEQLLAAEEEPAPEEPEFLPKESGPEPVEPEIPESGNPGRKYGWLLAVLLLEVGAGLLVLAWWLQWR